MGNLTSKFWEGMFTGVYVSGHLLISQGWLHLGQKPQTKPENSCFLGAGWFILLRAERILLWFGISLPLSAMALLLCGQTFLILIGPFPLEIFYDIVLTELIWVFQTERQQQFGKNALIFFFSIFPSHSNYFTCFCYGTGCQVIQHKICM